MAANLNSAYSKILKVFDNLINIFPAALDFGFRVFVFNLRASTLLGFLAVGLLFLNYNRLALHSQRATSRARERQSVMSLFRSEAAERGR